jgi:8-oxo-dGTP pyrophosphatase MutT (NUDIX family)
MNFDVPRETILPVDAIEVALDPARHPYEIDHLADIDENWRRETAANPNLFDGRMALLARLAYRERRIEGACHLVRFATFMHWRKTRPLTYGGHAFAHAMPVTADGALIAVRMGPRTANPGSVYFAAGSFETQDFPGGKVDIAFNMAREVGEETGIDLDVCDRDPAYHAWSGASGTVMFRRYYLPMTAAAAVRAIGDFVAAESDPEIEGPVVIRSPVDLPDGIKPHMRALVAWHFAERVG